MCVKLTHSLCIRAYIGGTGLVTTMHKAASGPADARRCTRAATAGLRAEATRKVSAFSKLGYVLMECVVYLYVYLCRFSLVQPCDTGIAR